MRPVPVTLYKIYQEGKFTPAPYIEFCEYAPGFEGLVNMGADRVELFEEAEVKVTRALVERVVFCGEEIFIAVDPKLKELLTLKERSEIATLELEINRQKRYIDSLKHDYEQWWSQPWYKRAWQAIRIW